jgi:hypothetical protein
MGTIQILLGARKIQAKLGTRRAADFLARNGVSIEAALWVLCRKELK